MRPNALSIPRSASARHLPAVALLAATVLMAVVMPVHALRVKEVASVQGVRTNQLTGYGLVVGLDGTGDQATQVPFTTQSLANYLQQMGITVPASAQSRMQPKNVAAVIVTAQLPAFAQPGQTIDINVSSMGNAKSLRGGTLIMTPLRGADGDIYALAQGNVVVGGAGASANGSKVQINQLSGGRIPAGGQVERAVATGLQQGDTVTLNLNSVDFSTAQLVVQAINGRLGDGLAQAIDGRTIEVAAPAAPSDRVAFIARIEELALTVPTPAAKVVINSRTGSIVLNQAVTLGACAVAHGSLSIVISTTPVISQPGAFSGGQTVVTQQSEISVAQTPSALVQLPASPQLTDVVRALNTLGANPQDLISILQAIKSAGALNAELEII